MLLRERFVAHGQWLRLLVGGMLIFQGLASVAFYMGSTIYFPLLHVSEVLSLNIAPQQLSKNYIGYLPHLIFGVISTFIGNWFWFSKKPVNKTVLLMSAAILFAAYIILRLRPILFF